jgi:hypothetical protein
MFQRKRLRVGGGEGPNELEYAHALKHHTRYMVKAAITTYFRCIPKKNLLPSKWMSSGPCGLLAEKGLSSDERNTSLGARADGLRPSIIIFYASLALAPSL